MIPLHMLKDYKTQKEDWNKCDISKFYACFVMRFHQICLVEAIAEDTSLDKLTKWGNTAFVLLSVISSSNDKLFYEMVVHCFLILNGK